MPPKKTIHKIITILSTASLVLLILLTGTPSLTAVFLSPGEIDNDEVTTGSTIIFKNVTLTIRSDERIPIDFLEFAVYNNQNNQLSGYTRFEVDGTKIMDEPHDSFTITRKTQLSSNWYGYGYNYGYDENFGYGYEFGFGYGYGYGNPSLEDITIVYDILFTTNIPGTFYATFAANCSTYEYTSESSANFMVISQYPPIPQKESIYPPSLSAVTDIVNFTYDFIDLEGDLDHLSLQISGPAPYDTSNNYITWTFTTNELDPWEGWNTNDILIAQDMGLTPTYDAIREQWTLSINTSAIWYNPNPWNQMLNTSVWPRGGYNFSVEVTDTKGNRWGSISNSLEFSTYYYAFHSVQPVIDKAQTDDTVMLLNGTFHDQIQITKKIALQGSGTSILQPQTIPQSGIYDVKLDGGSSGTIIQDIIFDFNGENDTRSGLGMSIGQASVVTRDITIKNNIFYPGNRTGVGGYAIHTMANSDVSGLSIRYNTIKGNDTCNGDGIFINPFYGPGHIEIYKNQIIGNISYGIVIQSSQVRVSSNIINTSSSNGFTGISFVDAAGGLTFSDVIIVSNHIHQFNQGIIIGNPSSTGSTLIAEISSNTISDNGVGILVRFGAVLQNSVHFNNILNNNFGLNNIGGSAVNATYNWWGHPSGPYHSSNPSGLGNPVSNNVLFSNWLSSIWNNTIWVDDNYDSMTPGWGIDHFNTTTDGISAAFDGGYVFLNPGIYHELLTIDKPLTLLAKYDFTNATIITDEQASFSEFALVNGQTIQIASNDVHIDSLRVDRVNNVSFNPGPAIGNQGYPDLYDIAITNCTINSMYDGIYLTNIDHVDIIGNDNISGDEAGIRLTRVNGSTIANNTIQYHDQLGVVAQICTNVAIHNNLISHQAIDALIIDRCDEVIVSHNQIMDCTNGSTIIDSEAVQILNTHYSGNKNGISLYGTTVADIQNNSFVDNIWNYTHVAHVENYLYFGTVQNGILHTGIGKNLFLYHGTYDEQVIIDKRIKIIGYDRAEDVIIDGGIEGPAITVGLNTDVDLVSIDQLTLISDSNGLRTGQYRDISGLTIKNCIIQSRGDDYAIFIDPHQFSDFPPIRNGTNPFSHAITIQHNHIRGGLFYQYHPFELYGVDINTQLLIKGNNMDVIRLNGSIAVDIIDNELWSIEASGTYGLTISENHIINDPGDMWNGINLWSLAQKLPVSKVLIHNNSIIGFSDVGGSQGLSGAGVLVTGGDDITIDENTIHANSKGIVLTEQCLTSDLMQCDGDITDLTINNNHIELGQTAIMLLTNVSHVDIFDNTLSNNGQGIWLRKAYANIISRNQIIDHYYGIRVDMNSSDNLIYDNYFMDNDIHAQDEFSNNKWNVTLQMGENIIGGSRIGGNWWDTYEGIDTDGDYIGDTLVPFTDNNNIKNGGDYLPLLLFDDFPPYVKVLYPNGGEVLNTSVTIEWDAYDNESVITNVAISYSDDGGSSWNLIADQEENDGMFDWDISGLPPGENYSIQIEVSDLAGNMNSDISDALFGIDEPTYPGIHVEILHPIKGWVYFFNRPTMRLFPQQVFIMGHITIEAEVESSIDLDRIEFFIDEQLMKTYAPRESNQYEWTWDERTLFIHTITVKAYDVFGHMESASIKVIIFNLDIIP